MDADEVMSEVIQLRHQWLTEHAPRSNRLLLHLPLHYADAVWSEFRTRLDPDERARAESGDGHPVDGGQLVGMLVCVEDEDEGVPWISELGSVKLSR